MIKSYLKTVRTQLSPNFASSEFNCPCNQCSSTLIDDDLIAKLELFRANLGSKIRISSGYRCASHQQTLRLQGFETAKGVSQHSLGKAADVTNDVSLGAELEEAARKAGFMAVGVARNWIHVDLRDGATRRWFYSKSKR